jgi:hypothetical protein
MSNYIAKKKFNLTFGTFSLNSEMETARCVSYPAEIQHKEKREKAIMESLVAIPAGFIKIGK